MTLVKRDEMNKDKIAKKRVQMGVQFLDVHYPKWELNVNVDEINLETNDCILGQVYGSYHDAIYDFGIHPRIAVQMGFDESGSISHKRLSRIWKKFLSKRLLSNVIETDEETTAVKKKAAPKKKAALKKSVKAS